MATDEVREFRPHSVLETATSDVLDVEPIERVDVTYVTYKRIRTMIMVGQLAPDSKVDLDVLADLLKVGRSTVANALKRLRLEDLVYIVPRQGTFVKAFSEEELRELYEVRTCIEVWAAEKGVANTTEDAAREIHRLLDEFVPLLNSPDAVGHAEFAIKNRDFHTFLVSLARNEKLLDIYKGLNIDVLGHRIYNFREFLRPKGDGPTEDTVRPRRAEHDEHSSIASAYVSGDSAAAVDAIQVHLRNSLNDYFRVVDLLRRS